MAESMIEADFDVLIAGGGPAGSALALALADGRRRIAVVEARVTPPTGDTRATALAAGSTDLLGALGVWQDLAADAVPIRRVEVSQQGHLGRTRIDATDEGLAALGHVVAHDRLAAALAAAAARAPGVTWLAPARVAGVSGASGAAGAPGAVTVEVEAAAPMGGAYHARLAVAADGADSPLRQALGIATGGHDYEQTALLARVDAGGDPHTAHERFTPDGPLALLPAGGRQRTLVWTVPAARAPELAALADGEFAIAAARRLGRSLGPVTVEGGRGTHPLRLVEAERTVAPRAVLIGNAARTLHPVAAQGFNLALRDVCTLAAALDDAARDGEEDPGASAVLAAWDRARRGDQWRTRGFTDLLARRFGGGGRLLAASRAGALAGLDLCAAGRHGLATQTTGRLGGLPRVGGWRLAQLNAGDEPASPGSLS